MKTTNCLDFDSEYDRDNTKYPCLFLFNPLTPTLSVYHTHNTDIKLQGIYIILVLIIYRHLHWTVFNFVKFHSIIMISLDISSNTNFEFLVYLQNSKLYFCELATCWFWSELCFKYLGPWNYEKFHHLCCLQGNYGCSHGITVFGHCFFSNCLKFSVLLCIFGACSYQCFEKYHLIDVMQGMETLTFQM